MVWKVRWLWLSTLVVMGCAGVTQRHLPPTQRDPILTDRKYKATFSPCPRRRTPRRRPHLARGDGGAPSAQRRPAAAARSQV